METQNPLFNGLLGLFCLLLTSPLWAAPASDKPFADKTIVLQISDKDAYKQALVLNVASNLVTHYGPDQIDIEVVAFGPGLRLLFDDNSNASRIDSLSESSGVRFSACSNTLKSITRTLGHAPALNPHADLVSAGVVRIIELTDQGYTLIKP